MTASDQQVSPEARLAAALDHAIAMTTDLRYDGPGADSLATYALQGDPTLAADLALAAAVRRLREYDFTVIVRDRVVSLWLDEDGPFTVHKWVNEAQAAITEALRDD